LRSLTKMSASQAMFQPSTYHNPELRMGFMTRLYVMDSVKIAILGGSQRIPNSALRQQIYGILPPPAARKLRTLAASIAATAVVAAAFTLHHDRMMYLIDLIISICT